MYELILMSKENILCNCKPWQSSKFLYDDRYTFIICFYLILRMDFFSVQNELSASNAVDTSQHVGQSWFTRTIFSDQRMNLSFIYIEGYILNCFCNTEVFTKIFYL